MPNLQETLSIRTDGNVDDLLSLVDWFKRDDALRGRVMLRSAEISDGQMGDIYQVAEIVGGGLAGALGTSLTTWLINRRSDVKVILRNPRGLELEVDAKRVNAIELVTEINKLSEQPGGTASAD
ncbi:hypothetical protein [Nocardia sp. AG03]|uniref:effector-associated constant component EACC1 n=1 Tax=Nocardia sp. AG03 TaxID=3025312 RepID=UPI00241855E9|nr:hypothetical protein [Nocardia sp. AG03]